MSERLFKYMREDFGDLPVTLNHLTMYLNFAGDFVEATNCLKMTAKQPIHELHLDANNIEIINVEWCKSPTDKGRPLDYEYLREKNRLVVKMPGRVEKGAKF